MTTCRICSTETEHKLYTVREMQFGTREEFIYFECGHCGCLQLRDVPSNLAKYYPDYYNAFSPIQISRDGYLHKTARYAKGKIVRQRLGGKSLLGKLFEKRFGSAFIPYWLMKEDLRLFSESKILDVGCGSGAALSLLENIGFKRLLGIDAFIPSGINYSNGIQILKGTLDLIDERFDFIMLHHSFEHMNEPLRVLQKLNALLNPSQYLLIRIPIASSYAWNHYGVNWSQIDAPRHLFLHSIESMTLLAEQGGFAVSEIIYDSISRLQFLASEQYAKDIPLWSNKSYLVDPAKSVFSKEEIDAFNAKAEALNQEELGDQACFYLRKRT